MSILMTTEDMKSACVWKIVALQLLLSMQKSLLCLSKYREVVCWLKYIELQSNKTKWFQIIDNVSRGKLLHKIDLFLLMESILRFKLSQSPVFNS